MKDEIKKVLLAEGDHAAVKKTRELNPKLSLIDAIEHVESIKKSLNAPPPTPPSEKLPAGHISLQKGVCMILGLSGLVVFGLVHYGNSTPYRSGPPATIPAPESSKLEMDHYYYNQTDQVVRGVIKNKSNTKFRYVQVRFNLYNAAGAHVGSTLTNTLDLEPNSEWHFSAYSTEISAIKCTLQGIDAR